MNKAVKPLLNTRMRPVEPKDFSVIRSLAAEFPAFTVPSEYILWFFSHFHPEFCRVLEHKSGEVKAYLLAMPTSDPKNGIAIWQIAAAQSNHAFALEYFAAYLRDLVEHTGAKSISFTTGQNEPTLRLIRSLAKQLFNCEVTEQNPVPVGQGEQELRLLLSN
jgi:hypothetical protein